MKNINTTIVRKTIIELEKLEKFVDERLPVILRDSEIKAFFIARHYEMPDFLIPLQRYVIREWEPRIPDLISPLTIVEYSRLRNWLGTSLNGLEKTNLRLPDIAKSKLRNYLYEAKVIFDLRNGEVADASSTIRSAEAASTARKGRI